MWVYEVLRKVEVGCVCMWLCIICKNSYNILVQFLGHLQLNDADNHTDSVICAGMGDHHLGVDADGAFALCAGVGADLFEALGAYGLLVLLHIFLALQVVAAVVAVEAFGHGGGEVAPGTC